MLNINLIIACSSAEAQIDQDRLWTFTYIKANQPNMRESLKKYIEQNWFAMDSIAVERGLFGQYELYENQADSATWDFIVAVEYFTENGYADVEDQFEEIRRKHKTANIKGLSFQDLGKVVSTETVTKHQYQATIRQVYNAVM